jgi:alanine racemase
MDAQTSWLDVDLDIMSENIRKIKNFIGNTKMMAVVKADAYGHGLLPVALCAIEHGAEYLGVSNIEEGVFLRQNGISSPILIFNCLLPEQADEAVKYDLTATVSSLDVVQALNNKAIKMNKNVFIHLKIDTGFGRFGILPDFAVDFVKIVTSTFKRVKLEGIYTHFSSATSEKTTRRQFRKFINVVEEIKAMDVNIPIKHVCNSLATIKYPEMHLDMVRVGNLIYGFCGQQTIGTKPVGKIVSRILLLKTLPAGHNVGYDNKFITKRPTRVAIIPFGYFDGLALAVLQPEGFMQALKTFIKLIFPSICCSKERKVKIKGKMCKIVGKIGMNNCMIDVTDLNNEVYVGDCVEISARRVNLRYTLPRVYRNKGQVFEDLRNTSTYNKENYQEELRRKHIG